jgi:hypothetical protein
MLSAVPAPAIIARLTHNADMMARDMIILPMERKATRSRHEMQIDVVFSFGKNV